MKKTKGNENALGGFFRRNALYFILALCIIAIGVSVALIMVGERDTLPMNNESGEVQPADNFGDKGDDQNDDKGDDEPTLSVITFCMPVESYSAIEEYTETLAYNSTLKRYSSHKAIDFYGDEGAKVYCAYDGVVKSVENSLLSGVTVTVDHGDGLITVYNSLLDAEDVWVGMQLKKGDIIGVISTSNRQEYKNGAHLHFETYENGVSVNPEKYLSIDSK